MELNSARSTIICRFQQSKSINPRIASRTRRRNSATGNASSSTVGGGRSESRLESCGAAIGRLDTLWRQVKALDVLRMDGEANHSKLLAAGILDALVDVALDVVSARIVITKVEDGNGLVDTFEQV